MPKYNCMNLKKYGGVCGVVMQNIFIDLKKCWEGYAKTSYGGLKLFGGYANKFCVWI